MRRRTGRPVHNLWCAPCAGWTGRPRPVQARGRAGLGVLRQRAGQIRAWAYTWRQSRKVTPGVCPSPMLSPYLGHRPGVGRFMPKPIHLASPFIEDSDPLYSPFSLEALTHKRWAAKEWNKIPLARQPRPGCPYPHQRPSGLGLGYWEPPRPEHADPAPRVSREVDRRKVRVFSISCARP